VRRRAALAISVLAVSMVCASCGHTDRPEGVVERWLISLNQGKAGQPETYAPDSLSQRIVPNWRTEDPGQLDVIEVGKGRPVLHSCNPNISQAACRAIGDYEVPFRTVRTDDRSRGGLAVLVDDATGWSISRLQLGDLSMRVPSQGGQRIGNAGVPVWLAALGVAFLLVLLSAGLMTTVGRRKTPV
jgi:hypothetical protein